MLTIQQIISESDVHVPNAFDIPQKVMWLNEVNNEFFGAVKIPRTLFFDVLSGLDQYDLTAGITAKNIDKVIAGSIEHQSMQFSDVQSGRCYWSFDDALGTLTLRPEPDYDAGGVVRYFQAPQTTFMSSDLTAKPDAPPEYHWLYVLGLCERITKAMNDFAKAANYGSDFRNQLMVAQQNYQRGDGR